MSSAGEAVNSLLQEYQAKLGNVAPKAVGIQLALMFGLSLGTVLAFSILRPRNKIIYAPKYKYSTEEKRPPKIDDGLFSWIGPLRTTKEPDMLVEMGLDAVIFLRFLRMCRWLFTAIAVTACGVLMPINIIYNLREVPAGSRNFLSTLTIANVKGASLWAHVAMSYIICFITFWFIWLNYKRVVELKHAYFRSKEYTNSLHARSIMITGVQRQHQTDDGLQSLLANLGVPYPTSSVHIGRKVGQLPELVEAHNNAVRELEEILTTYTKDGTLAKKRPTMRVGGLLGMGGKKVDSIDYYTAKVKKLEEKVDQTRDTISDRKSEPYGFASFQAVPYAHVVAKRLQDKKVKGCKFSLAPLPSDIIWKNLSTYHRSKAMSRGVIAIFLIALCALYTIPLVAVSFLANLPAITQYVGFLNVWSNESEWTFSAFVGVAPPLLSAILQLLLPVIMRKLTKKQGLLTRNQVNRTVMARYWAFLIITQLIIFSLLGVVFNLITELVIEFGKGGDPLRTILKEVNKLPARINQTYLAQSNYWLTWLPLRAWAAVFDIAQVINLVWVWARAKAFGRTPREIREWTKPPPFDYAVYFANSLLVVAVAMIYAPLAPLIPILAAVAFFASSFLYKYMLLYVNVTKVESGGRMWRLCVNRMLICLVFMQAIMVLTIGLQHGWIRSITCVPPVVLVFIFKMALSRTFDDKYTWYSPTDQEVANAVLHRSDDRKGRLFKRFGNPVISEPLFTPMIHKKSQHLLRQIYSGRMAEDDYIGTYEENIKAGVLGTAGNADTGGLQFKAIDESELQQSREAYLREQDVWETGSISTAMGGAETPMYRGDASQAFFEAKKREYMQHGPSRPDSPATMEMSRIPSGQGNPGESQENLIYGNSAGRGTAAAAAYGRQMATPGSMYQGGYQPTAMASYDDVGLAYGANQSGYFDDSQSNYAGRGAAPQYRGASPGPGAGNNYPPSYAYPPLPAGAGRSNNGSPPQPYNAQFSSNDRHSPDMGWRPVHHHQSTASSQQYSQSSSQAGPGGRGHQMHPSNASSQDLSGGGRRYYGDR